MAQTVLHIPISIFFKVRLLWKIYFSPVSLTHYLLKRNCRHFFFTLTKKSSRMNKVEAINLIKFFFVPQNFRKMTSWWKERRKMFLREITRVLQKLKFEGGQTEIPKPEFLQLTIGTMERKKRPKYDWLSPKNNATYF